MARIKKELTELIGGTPQVAEPPQTVSEKRKPTPTLII